MNIGLKGQAAMRTLYEADYILGSVYNVMCAYLTPFQLSCCRSRDITKVFVSDKATGSSMDWAYDVGKVPLAFCFELRDARNGICIFDLLSAMQF